MGNLFKKQKNFETTLREIEKSSKGTYIPGVDEPQNINIFLGANGVRGECPSGLGYKLNPDFENLPPNIEELINNKKIEGYNNLMNIHEKYKNKEIDYETAVKMGTNEIKIVHDYKWSLDPPKYIKITET